MNNGRADGEHGRILAAMELARRFHETYARLAPAFREEARTESAVPWGERPEQHKRLMVAVCYELQRSDDAGVAPLQDVAIMNTARPSIRRCRMSVKAAFSRGTPASTLSRIASCFHKQIIARLSKNMARQPSRIIPQVPGDSYGDAEDGRDHAA